MKIVRCNRCLQDISPGVKHGAIRHGHHENPIYETSTMPNGTKHFDLCPSCDVDLDKFLSNQDVPARVDFETWVKA